MATPGKGKWRLPGRGRRLKCQPKGYSTTEPCFLPFRYYDRHRTQCRWCGRVVTWNQYIGTIEQYRIVDYGSNDGTN